MYGRKLVYALATVLTTLVMTAGPALAAPNPGPGSRLRNCTWDRTIYISGSLRQAPVIFDGKVIHYDIYQCQDGSWIYVGSSDDMN